MSEEAQKLGLVGRIKQAAAASQSNYGKFANAVNSRPLVKEGLTAAAGVAGLGAATGVGAAGWNLFNKAEDDIDGGDLAKAAMLLGIMGYGGARGLDAFLTKGMGWTRHSRVERDPSFFGIGAGYSYPGKMEANG